MALIVLMEDDAATRMLVASVLKKDGHEVAAAEDGAAGLALVRERRPDLIISDVQMPHLNGFQVLEAVKAEPLLASTPMILLTSLQERAHMRIGMTTGADDYITKPFRPQELREAVSAQLNKRLMQARLQESAIVEAVTMALEEQRDELARRYEQRLAKELSERWPTTQTGEDGDGDGDERFETATVLFVDIPQYAAVAEKLSPAELTELVKRFYGSANDTVHLFGARYMQFIGEGLLAVFTDDTNTDTVNHALRAARTAIGLVDASRGIANYLRTTYPGRSLPPFSANVALNSGAVTLTNLEDPLHGGSQRLPVGDAVSSTIQLQKHAAALGWPIAASAGTVRAIMGAVQTGRRALVDLPGRSQQIDAVELLKLAAAPASP